MTTLEKFTAQVYTSSDTNAPALERSANSVSTIFKACLVTGYGDKQAAGWQMAYEDTENGVKVIKPPVNADTDFYLRLSQDDGRQLNPQVYTSMTDVNTGTLRCQCPTFFKYSCGAFSSEWLLIATKMGFWFFTGNAGANGLPKNKIGHFFYCGFTAKNTVGTRGVYLKHTGGGWAISDDDRYSIFKKSEPLGSTQGKLYVQTSGAVSETSPICFFNGSTNYGTEAIVCPLYLIAENELFRLPAFAPSKKGLDNFATATDGVRNFINHNHSLIGGEHNMYIPTDYWEL